MAKFLGLLIAAGVVPLISGALYFAAPLLRSPEAMVNEEVDVHVEHARRLLMRFGENVDALARLLQQLEAGGVDVTLSSDRIDELLEQDRAIFEDADASLKAKARGPAALRRRQLEERYRAAGGSAGNGAPPVGIGGNIAVMARRVREAVKNRDALLGENDKLLDQALAQINKALAVASGDAIGSSHPHANRLKGIILMARARARYQDAQRLRALADERGERLVDLAGDALHFEIEQQIVQTSDVQGRIEELEHDAGQFRSDVRSARSDIRRLDVQIRDMEAIVERLNEHAAVARAAMDRLADEGVNLLDPKGSETFAQQYSLLSEEYGRALTQAHQLEYGMLEGARIDDSGDYLRGRFVPVTPSTQITEKRGLVDFRHDREKAGTDLDGYVDAQAAVESSLDDLQLLAQTYAERVAIAIDETDRLRREGADVYDQMVDYADQADVTMEAVTGEIRGALAAFGAAAMTSGNRARDASDRIAGASQALQDRSPRKQRSEAKWLTGQIDNEVAQARFLLAVTLNQRYAAAGVDAARATKARELLGLTQADPAAFAERRDLAREEGIRAVRQGIAGFEKSSRLLNNSWTVAAQNGGAHYLLSILEDTDHLATAIENYAAAIDGRETEIFVRPFVLRLQQLRNRRHSHSQ